MALIAGAAGNPQGAAARAQIGTGTNFPAVCFQDEIASKTNAMPQFYFHIRDANGLTRDLEGQELPDLETARHEAVSAAREILGEKLLHGGSLNGRTIEIANQDGQVVGRVDACDILFQDGNFRSYADDVTQSAPTNSPRK
jgi:hypothetical protein